MRIRNVLPALAAAAAIAVGTAGAAVTRPSESPQPSQRSTIEIAYRTSESGMIAPGSQTGAAVLALQMQETLWNETVWRAEIARQLDVIDAELDAQYARQAAAAGRTQALGRDPGRTSASVPQPSGGGTSCDGHVVPGYILQRESGCSYGAYNATGCGGSGCIGLYQLDAKHFSSTCAGLDTSPAGQDACAQKLVDAGGLSPWASTR